MHKRQYATNVLRRVARLQVAGNMSPQSGSSLQPARNARCDRAGMGARMARDASLDESSRLNGVRETASRPNDSTHGNRRRVDALLQFRVRHDPFFKTQLRVDVSRATFSPQNVARGIRVRAPINKTSTTDNAGLA